MFVCAAEGSTKHDRSMPTRAAVPKTHLINIHPNECRTIPHRSSRGSEFDSLPGYSTYRHG